MAERVSFFFLLFMARFLFLPTAGIRRSLIRRVFDMLILDVEAQSTRVFSYTFSLSLSLYSPSLSYNVPTVSRVVCVLCPSLSLSFSLRDTIELPPAELVKSAEASANGSLVARVGRRYSGRDWPQ